MPTRRYVRSILMIGLPIFLMACEEGAAPPTPATQSTPAAQSGESGEITLPDNIAVTTPLQTTPQPQPLPIPPLLPGAETFDATNVAGTTDSVTSEESAAGSPIAEETVELPVDTPADNGSGSLPIEPPSTDETPTTPDETTPIAEEPPPLSKPVTPLTPISAPATPPTGTVWVARTGTATASEPNAGTLQHPFGSLAQAIQFAKTQIAAGIAVPMIGMLAGTYNVVPITEDFSDIEKGIHGGFTVTKGGGTEYHPLNYAVSCVETTMTCLSATSYKSLFTLRGSSLTNLYMQFSPPAGKGPFAAIAMAQGSDLFNSTIVITTPSTDAVYGISVNPRLVAADDPHPQSTILFNRIVIKGAQGTAIYASYTETPNVSLLIASNRVLVSGAMSMGIIAEIWRSGTVKIANNHVRGSVGTSAGGTAIGALKAENVRIEGNALTMTMEDGATSFALGGIVAKTIKQLVIGTNGILLTLPATASTTFLSGIELGPEITSAGIWQNTVRLVSAGTPNNMSGIKIATPTALQVINNLISLDQQSQVVPLVLSKEAQKAFYGDYPNYIQWRNSASVGNTAPQGANMQWGTFMADPPVTAGLPLSAKLFSLIPGHQAIAIDQGEVPPPAASPNGKAIKDLLGQSRPLGKAFDLGAIEYQ
ncbi:MAG: hypothetical protein HYV02_08235 [Deltaproteobacteria bacterium]|nr:hypothetical protein [Deltaproteobacteria bacterium]